MARSEVFLTSDAEEDLAEITDYIEARASDARAESVFARIKQAILTLESSPRRGRIVPELGAAGVSEYRELLVQPYRIVYFVAGRRVFVVAIWHGRRDVQELLGRRLLR